MSDCSTFSFAPGALAKAGLPIEKLCARAGVEPTDTWTTEAFFRLWEAADDELDDPSAGLRFGSGSIDRGYGTASIVALHAPDLRRALAALSRYKRLTCPELVEVEISGNEAIVRYRWLQASNAVPRLLVDTTLASLKEMTRRGSAGRVAPLRIELARRQRDRELLQEHFGCPVAFGAAYDAMVFDRASLDVAFVGAGGGAFAHVLEGLERRLTDGEGVSGIVAELRLTIARHLSEGRSPTLGTIARRLGISRRTLQRRLDAHGTSFQQQLTAVRHTLAGRLLINTQLDFVAIAMLLGFSEPNSFSRAFRGWEQTTPLRWRHQRISA